MPTGLSNAGNATVATQTAGQPATRKDPMKLTVFGATGGIGGHVVRQALAAGHHVTAVVRDRPVSSWDILRSMSRPCPA
jgi:NADPH:quinone reductase-like Zn-dependent oxidoreductase